jgi:homoserine kinase
MSSQGENGKLVATAVGAAAAGASLAVIAMRMIDSSSGKNKRGKGPYDYDPQDRPNRPSVLMNEYPSEEYELRRESSEQMLFPHNHEEKMRRRIATRYTIEEENNMPRDSVTVRVPATSANVGPGCKSFFHFFFIIFFCFSQLSEKQSIVLLFCSGRG